MATREIRLPPDPVTGCDLPAFVLQSRSADEFDVLVRFVAKLPSLVPLVSGLALLGLALARYRLPYENGRYFDPQTQVVYHFQAAEVLLITAIVLILVGLGIAGAGLHRLQARERPVKS